MTYSWAIDLKTSLSHKDITSEYYQVLIAKKRPRGCKILWIFIVALCLGFTGFMVNKQEFPSLRSFAKLL